MTMNDLKVEVFRFLPHAPERVFDAWLDPKVMARFLIPAPGMSEPKVTADPKEGGRFQVIMTSPDTPEGWPHDGEYQIIDRAKRLQFTWVSAYTQDDSTVTLDFTPNGNGTDLRLTHVRFPHKESRDNHEGGWTRILEALDQFLT